MADFDHSEQDGYVGCQVCTRRSDWDFLKAFYQREEMAKNQIQGLNGHIVQLNAALHHAGVTSQKDRVALNNAHEHLKELQARFIQSNTARARLENELHDERQQYRIYQEILNHERVRHNETEKSLDYIWNSHNKLGDIMSRVEYDMDSNLKSASGMRYNITDLVLELAAKADRISNLESNLEQTRHQHDTEVLELKQKLHLESTQHTEEYINQSQRIHQLDLLLQREHIKDSVEEKSIEPRQDSKPRGRRRHFRRRNKTHNANLASGLANNHGEKTDRAGSLTPIKEESL